MEPADVSEIPYVEPPPSPPGAVSKSQELSAFDPMGVARPRPEELEPANHSLNLHPGRPSQRSRSRSPVSPQSYRSRSESNNGYVSPFRRSLSPGVNPVVAGPHPSTSLLAAASIPPMLPPQEAHASSWSGAPQPQPQPRLAAAGGINVGGPWLPYPASKEQQTYQERTSIPGSRQRDGVFSNEPEEELFVQDSPRQAGQQYPLSYPTSLAVAQANEAAGYANGIANQPGLAHPQPGWHGSPEPLQGHPTIPTGIPAPLYPPSPGQSRAASAPQNHQRPQWSPEEEEWDDVRRLVEGYIPKPTAVPALPIQELVASPPDCEPFQFLRFNPHKKAGYFRLFNSDQSVDCRLGECCVFGSQGFRHGKAEWQFFPEEGTGWVRIGFCSAGGLMFGARETLGMARHRLEKGTVCAYMSHRLRLHKHTPIHLFVDCNECTATVVQSGQVQGKVEGFPAGMVAHPVLLGEGSIVTGVQFSEGSGMRAYNIAIQRAARERRAAEVAAGKGESSILSTTKGGVTMRTFPAVDPAGEGDNLALGSSALDPMGVGTSHQQPEHFFQPPRVHRAAAGTAFRERFRSQRRERMRQSIHNKQQEMRHLPSLAE